MFVVILLSMWTHTASGLLIVKPQDTQVLAGQVATLNCSTSLTEDLHWYYDTAYVYAGRKLASPYNNRLKVEVYEHNGATAFNLVFSWVKPEDAGRYVCRDTQGSGEISSAEMTVLTTDRYGPCQSNVPPNRAIFDETVQNHCYIHPDEVMLSCSVTFYGKNPPQLEWKKFLHNGYSAATSECQTINNRIICYTPIAGHRQRDRSVYKCQTTGSSELNIRICTIEVTYIIHTACQPVKPDGILVFGHNIECIKCIVFDFCYMSDYYDSTHSTSTSQLSYILKICAVILLFILVLLSCDRTLRMI